MTYIFHNRVYNKPFAPYYDAYKEHIFSIDHVMKEDTTGEHVWVVCIDDPSIKVNGYVHRKDLVEVEALHLTRW